LSFQRALDCRVVDVAEVLVVERLDRVGVQQQVEVRRVREVLDPVGEAGLGLVFALPIVGK
jgi:hypothetical protein